MKKRLTLTINQELSKNILKAKTDVLVVGVNEDKALNSLAQNIDNATNGVIKKLIKRKEFEGKIGQTAYIAASEGTSADRIFLVGFGKTSNNLNSDNIDKISSAITGCLTSKQSVSGSVCMPSVKFEAKEMNDSDLLQRLGTSIESKAYTYDSKLNKKNKKVNHLKKVSISLDSKQNITRLRKGLKTGQAIGQGMNVAKDLANLPGNVCTPSYLASSSRAAAKKYPNLSCRVFG